MPEATQPNPKARLKIGFVHRFDARDIRSWSGIFFFMSRALNTHVGDVVYLGPDKSRGTKFIIDNTARVNRFWERFTGKILATDHNRVLSRRLGRFFERQLRETPCDILFAPVASVEIASLNTDIPIVYYSDITWADIVDYYPEFSSVSPWGREEGDRIEASAIARAKAAVYPSQWAVDSACNHYGAGIEKTFKVSFGANLNDPPSRETALARSLKNTVNLLIVGVDWNRKGGAIAYECLTSLLDRGVDAKLTLLGCVPPKGFEHPNFRVIPFLSKHDPEQRNQIRQLFLEAHFMLLPTKADATPIVTCEASAFGLPTLASDTGGLRGSIRDGMNGYLIPAQSPGKIYADKVISIIADPKRYRDLVVSSRNEFESSLNWDSWGKSIRSVMESVLSRQIFPYTASAEQPESTLAREHDEDQNPNQGDASDEIPEDLPVEVSRA